MENRSKQNKEKLCRRMRVGIGIFLVALGVLVADGAFGTMLIIIGVLSFISGIIWACPCSALMGSSKAEKVCCLSSSASKRGCCPSQNNGEHGERRCC